MPLFPQVGEIWLFDTTSIYKNIPDAWSKPEHWLILKSGPANQIDPHREEYSYYASKDHAVYYIHLETGRHDMKVFYQRDSNTVLDFYGNPYYKRVA